MIYLVDIDMYDISSLVDIDMYDISSLVDIDMHDISSSLVDIGNTDTRLPDA